MPKHRMEQSHPYSKPHEDRDGHMTLEELNANDHLCPHHAGVAPLPDSNRETWMEHEANPYPTEPEEKPE